MRLVSQPANITRSLNHLLHSNHLASQERHVKSSASFASPTGQLTNLKRFSGSFYTNTSKGLSGHSSSPNGQPALEETVKIFTYSIVVQLQGKRKYSKAKYEQS